jgi:hypothetical protein
MILGVPLDYRNDYDISNVVAAFGKFHHWHQDDAIEERTLVFVSYPSTALVPRDIVFGNYANLGGVRESWTAPCYVLAPAVFAEQLPEDEDQMPLNGNPHPLPGNLVHNNNIFVLQPFPELGWNNAPLHGQHLDQQPPHQQHNIVVVDNVQEEVQDNEAQLDVVVDDSIVMNPSAGSDAGMDNGVDNMVVDQQININNALVPRNNNVLHIGFVHTIFGPVLPPSMLWDRLLDSLVPNLYASAPVKPLFSWPIQSSILTKSSLAVVGSHDFTAISSVSVARTLLSPKRRSVARSLFIQDIAADSDSSHSLAPPVFSASPLRATPKKRKPRAKKSDAKVVMFDTEFHRSTRSSARRDGYRPLLMSDTVSRPRKKSKTMKKSVEQEKVPRDNEELDIPETPIKVMQ